MIKQSLKTVTLALLISHSAQATVINSISEAEKLSYEDLMKYRQDHYQLLDPVGDYILFRGGKAIPPQIFFALTKSEKSTLKKVAVEDSEPYEDLNYVVPVTKVYQMPATAEEADTMLAILNADNAKVAQLFTPKENDSAEVLDAKKAGLVATLNMSLQGSENPLIRTGFKSMFAQIIEEEKSNGINPILGEPHKWSKEFKSQYGSDPLMISSKLLMALSLGRTNRYMKTDMEESLYKWVHAQPDNSVTLSSMFRQSYILNNGDVYKTLLTVENMLAHQWRNVKRELLPLTQRLKPITSGLNYNKDRFGTWYHLFGIMLYGYVEGGTKASQVGAFEALGGKILAPQMARGQKVWMNKSGGPIGDDLAEMIKQGTTSQFAKGTDSLNEANYLNRTEDFTAQVKMNLDPAVVKLLGK